jgi:hypothetical protein
MTAPSVTHSSYWGLACRRPDIADLIYSGAHPWRIGHINYIFFFVHAGQVPRGYINYFLPDDYFNYARHIDYF